MKGVEQMKRAIVLIFLLPLFALVQVKADLLEDLSGRAIGIGLDLIAKPNELFTDLQNDIHDVTPGPFGRKHVQFYTHPLLDLTTVANVGIKAHVFDQKGHIPRITLGFSYWNVLAFKLIPDFKNNSLSGYTPSITFSGEVQYGVRLFSGFKYPVGVINLSLKDLISSNPGEDSLSNPFLQDIRSVYQLPTLFAGISYLAQNKREITASVGYSFIDSRISAKIQGTGRVVSWGIGFYPEAVFLLHPFMSLNLKF
jgi:hypothetical protein